VAKISALPLYTGKPFSLTLMGYRATIVPQLFRTIEQVDMANQDGKSK
jgi:hypothetical protein